MTRGFSRCRQTRYVRVEAIVLNPSDTKMRGAFATP
jgi:NADPH:quinone reductase-like Zn-dependent oxidoreductase